MALRCVDDLMHCLFVFNLLHASSEAVGKAILIKLDLSVDLDRVIHSGTGLEVSKIVVLDDTSSDIVQVVFVDPHGHVLGPLSFIHYTSGLFETVENKVLLYVDDLILAVLILVLLIVI